MEKNKNISVTESKVQNLSLNIIDRLQKETEATVKGLQALPGELEKHLSELKELHEKTQIDLQAIDKMSTDFLKRIFALPPDLREQHVSKICDFYKEVESYGDDKVLLATQTYELVDRHIRRLDSDLARFEADLKDKTLNPMQAEQEKKKAMPVGEKEKRKGRRPVCAEDDIPKSVRKKLKIQTIVQPEVVTPLPVSLEMAHPSDVLDMPVDPNEPTYCFCHQVSYGEMIGCDNSDCLIEWFHFACVGLTSKPKGKWYCSNCSAERKKK